MALWQFLLLLFWHEVCLHLLCTLPFRFRYEEQGEYGTGKRHRSIQEVYARVVDQACNVGRELCYLGKYSIVL